MIFARPPAFVLANVSIPVSASIGLQSASSDDEAAAGACGCLGAFGLFFVIFFLVIIALDIALLVWVARDAKARGMDGSILWMFLVLLLSVLGLIIYLLSRPKGRLVPCAYCANRRMEVSANCPHCGNA